MVPMKNIYQINDISEYCVIAYLPRKVWWLFIRFFLFLPFTMSEKKFFFIINILNWKKKWSFTLFPKLLKDILLLYQVVHFEQMEDRSTSQIRPALPGPVCLSLPAWPLPSHYFTITEPQKQLKNYFGKLDEIRH